MICCETCVSWSNDEPAIATGQRRPAGADPTIGICRFSAPVVVTLAGMVTSRFPETHAQRVCDHWMGHDHDEPDGGERVGKVLPFRSAA